jgi:hypothetical protein
MLRASLIQFQPNFTGQNDAVVNRVSAVHSRMLNFETLSDSRRNLRHGLRDFDGSFLYRGKIR